MVRNIFDKVKLVTNTCITDVRDSTRRNELKVTKFFKKDDGSMNKTKIFKQAAEGMKYTSKRQPLATKREDDQIFDLS